MSNINVHAAALNSQLTSLSHPLRHTDLMYRSSGTDTFPDQSNAIAGQCTGRRKFVKAALLIHPTSVSSRMEEPLCIGHAPPGP